MGFELPFVIGPEYIAVALFGVVIGIIFGAIPGMTATMYSLLSLAEFLGRSLGGMVQYRTEIPEKKKYGFAFLVYMLYETVDLFLLWLPYPLMLVSRGLCGFLGINSATMRQAAVQRYIPDRLRARVNALYRCGGGAVPGHRGPGGGAGLPAVRVSVRWVFHGRVPGHHLAGPEIRPGRV